MYIYWFLYTHKHIHICYDTGNLFITHKRIFFALFWRYASIVGRCYNTTVWYSDKNHSSHNFLHILYECPMHMQWSDTTYPQADFCAFFFFFISTVSLLKICISTRYIHIWVSGYKYRQSETLKINNYQRFIKRFVGLSV